MSEQIIKIALVGVGNIGRAFLQLLIDKRSLLREKHRLALQLVAAADSSAIAIDPNGLCPAQLLAQKNAGHPLAELSSSSSRSILTDALPSSILDRVQVDLLAEASPTNIQNGEPGLSAIRAAIQHGCHIVSANKGPFVLAFPSLLALAQRYGVTMRFSAAVADACPTVNLGQRDLAGCAIERVEGILNMTTNHILCQMADHDLAFDAALVQAQAQGIAEADPTLDIDGWDTANKLVILANSVLGMPATLDDVQRQGIRGFKIAALQAAGVKDMAIKLVATAEKAHPYYTLSVKPTALPLSHPLARLSADQLGIVYHTDIQGTMCAIAGEQGTVSTAAAMLRDLLDIYG